MAKKKRTHKAGMTLPLAIVAGMVPFTVGTVQHGMWFGWSGPGDTALDYFVRSLTGYSPNGMGYGGHFNIRNLQQGAIPLAIGFLAHKIIGGSLGVNRALGRAKIPFLRI